MRQAPGTQFSGAIAACCVRLEQQNASELGANGLPSVAVDPRSVDDAGIEANIALFSVSGTRLLLVTVDLLFVGSSLTRAVRDVVSKVAPGVDVWISASHTHRAPAVDFDKPRLGAASAEVVVGLCAQVASAVGQLLMDEAHPTDLSPRIGTADMAGLSVHRRARGRPRITRKGLRLGGVVMAPNFAEPVQRKAVRVDWVDESGAVQCVMWHWACHPTAAPDPLTVSADYVGVVREAIRDQVGQVPVLFFQGFAGDIRPPAVRTWRTNPLRRALIGPGFRPFSRSEYCEWSDEVARRVVIARPTAEATPINQWPEVSSSRYTCDAEAFVKGSPTPAVVVQQVAIGPLRIFGVSAEPSYGHVPVGISPETDWYCGYLEDVYGYLPTEQQYAEGGYEVDGFCSAFACEALRLEGVRSFSSMMAERAAQDVAT